MTDTNRQNEEQRLPFLRELATKQTEGSQKLYIKEAVIVEGRYDKIKLSECIASPIIETGGFRVFKDKEKQTLIRRIAERRGILVMTDVDSAGFVIRNFLRGIVPEKQIRHAYIPTIEGKERRKAESSKEGILGVEGIDREALIASIRKSGAHIFDRHCEERQATRQSQPLSNGHCGQQSLPLVKGGGTAQADPEGLYHCSNDSENHTEITKLDFFDYGLTGCENAAQHREEVLASLGLPKYLTANAMIAAMNCLFTKEEFEAYLTKENPDIK